MGNVLFHMQSTLNQEKKKCSTKPSVSQASRAAAVILGENINISKTLQELLKNELKEATSLYLIGMGEPL